MKKKNENKNLPNIVIYQSKNGGIEFKGDLQKETLWATQAQIADVFEIERSVVTKHINNLIKNLEVDEKSNVQKMHIANSDKLVNFYSLDMVLAVGYRANSKKAIEFRKWATKVVGQFVTSGFVVDRRKVIENYDKFMSVIEDIKVLLPENTEAFKSVDALDLVKLFAETWLSLDKIDKEDLTLKKVSKEIVKLETQELQKAVDQFKKVLIKKGEATDFFATDRNKESLEGIVGNVMQSFGGNSVYKNVEEKAAHLFYFIIKNHPFVDGNKRTGAFSFIWYLAKNNRLDKNKVTPNMLTTLTLLVAESDPAHKDKIVKVVMKLIEKK